MIKTDERLPTYHLKHLTADDYFELPDDGFCYELIDGVMVVSPSADMEHSDIDVQLLYQINLFIQDKKIGKVFTELDIRFSDQKVYRPDISFIANDKLHLRTRNYPATAPDLVVEITSEGTKDLDFGKKSEDYFDFGVKEYWIVDRKRSSIYFSTRGQRDWETQFLSDTLQSTVLPGFALNIKSLFEEIG